MQPKLKAFGIHLNLHLIINGNHVTAVALIIVIIIVLSLINILMMKFLVYGKQMLGGAVLVDMAKDLITQSVIADQITKI